MFTLEKFNLIKLDLLKNIQNDINNNIKERKEVLEFIRKKLSDFLSIEIANNSEVLNELFQKIQAEVITEFKLSEGDQKNTVELEKYLSDLKKTLENANTSEIKFKEFVNPQDERIDKLTKDNSKFEFKESIMSSNPNDFTDKLNEKHNQDGLFKPQVPELNEDKQKIPLECNQIQNNEANQNELLPLLEKSFTLYISEFNKQDWENIKNWLNKEFSYPVNPLDIPANNNGSLCYSSSHVLYLVLKEILSETNEDDRKNLIYNLYKNLLRLSREERCHRGNGVEFIETLNGRPGYNIVSDIPSRVVFEGLEFFEKKLKEITPEALRLKLIKAWILFNGSEDVGEKNKKFLKEHLFTAENIEELKKNLNIKKKSLSISNRTEDEINDLVDSTFNLDFEMVVSLPSPPGMPAFLNQSNWLESLYNFCYSLPKKELEERKKLLENLKKIADIFFTSDKFKTEK